MITHLAIYQNFVIPEGILQVSVLCALLNKLCSEMYNNDVCISVIKSWVQKRDSE